MQLDMENRFVKLCSIRNIDGRREGGKVLRLELYAGAILGHKVHSEQASEHAQCLQQQHIDALPTRQLQLILHHLVHFRHLQHPSVHPLLTTQCHTFSVSSNYHNSVQQLCPRHMYEQRCDKWLAQTLPHR